MRNIILLMLFAFQVGGQTIRPVHYSSPEVGTIFYETSFASTSDFPITGSGITRGTNKLDLTGNPTLFTSYVLYNNANNPHRYTGLERWTQRVRLKVTSTKNSTSYGIGIGVRSDNGYAVKSTYVRWSWDNSGAGKIYLYNVEATTNQIVSGTALVATASTYYWIEVKRDLNDIITTIYSDGAYNPTAPSLPSGNQLYTVTQTFNTSTGSTVPHNVGRFAIHQFGGADNEVTHWYVFSTEKRNQDYLFIGDSNTRMHASSLANSWPALAATTAGVTYTVSWGWSDRTAEVLLKLPEIIAMRPKVVFLSIGRNDIANSVSEATREANVDTIIATLEAAGIKVQLGGCIASNVQVATMQDHMNAKPNDHVDFYQATKGAGTGLNATYNSGDNIHINDAGHSQVATTAVAIMGVMFIGFLPRPPRKNDEDEFLKMAA
jgi:hypothetical protein